MLFNATLCYPRSVIYLRAQHQIGNVARRLLASTSASFDTFLAANSPPSTAPPEDSWTRSDSNRYGAGISTGHSHAFRLCGEARRFHWRQAQAEAAQLARHNHMHWSSALDGYVCMPQQDTCSVSAAATAEQLQQDESVPARLAEHQRQQQGSSNAAAAVTAQPLLLKLPAILWGADHMRQGRLHDVISGEAAPGLQLIVLLSADSAAVAVCCAGNVVRHKTMTGYTVRRNRNGKTQLTNRRTRPGKNSVGGGIRMRETTRLFQNVASRLTEWHADIEACDLMVCSGGIRVWNEVFAAVSDAGVIQRADARWWRLPLSVPRPRYTDLQRALGVLSYGSITPLTPAP